MGQVIKLHPELGDIDIAGIDLNHRCCNDMPHLLIGLQEIYRDHGLGTRLFALLEEHLLPHVSHGPGCPGMAL